MSVKVDLDQLGGTLADYPVGYLITVDDDYRAHTVAVTPVLADGVLDVGPVGATTQRNVTAHNAVTVLCPPAQPGGYSLIVDGTGRLTDTSLQVLPGRAVLHRKAAEDSRATDPGCLHDCVRLES